MLQAADRAVGMVAEIACAILVASEIVILFAGVIARYVLHRPLVWSDELASILFLWLGILGSGARAPARRPSAHDDGGQSAAAAPRRDGGAVRRSPSSSPSSW